MLADLWEWGQCWGGELLKTDLCWLYWPFREQAHSYSIASRLTPTVMVVAPPNL